MPTAHVSYSCNVCGERYAIETAALSCEARPNPADWPVGQVLRHKDGRLWRVEPLWPEWAGMSFGHCRPYALCPILADGSEDGARKGLSPFADGLFLLVLHEDEPAVVSLGGW